MVRRHAAADAGDLVEWYRLGIVAPRADHNAELPRLAINSAQRTPRREANSRSAADGGPPRRRWPEDRQTRFLPGQLLRAAA